jgi:hypothetical protein
LPSNKNHHIHERIIQLTSAVNFGELDTHLYKGKPAESQGRKVSSLKAKANGSGTTVYRKG